MSRVYLDHNASSPLRPEAREAMLAAMETCGNPSSIHAEGRRARAILESARETVAAVMGVSARDVTFTSGGTEAANGALSPRARFNGWPAQILLFGATEHACVLTGHGFASESVAPLSVNGSGLADLDELETRLKETHGSGAVIAVQAANNETGVLQPAKTVADMVHGAGAATVCDAVQMIGRAPVDAAALGADIILLSGHKFGGPKGVGAMLANADTVQINPIVRGGGQERGRRAGTENVAAIAGFAAALETAARSAAAFGAFALSTQKTLEAGLRGICPHVVIFGEDAPRLPNTICFAAPGLAAETLLMAFDLEGVAVSSGSACSSGKVSASHVLAAMGVAPELARCAIRVSTGWTTTDADIERFLQVWEKIYTRLRARAAA